FRCPRHRTERKQRRQNAKRHARHENPVQEMRRCMLAQASRWKEPMSNASFSSTLLQDVSRRAAAYLEGLDARKVAPDPAAVAALDAFDGDLPEMPDDPHKVIDLLDRYGSPATMAMAGPRFFGFVIGGSLPVALAADWLAAAWDQNTGYYNITPATARIE